MTRARYIDFRHRFEWDWCIWCHPSLPFMPVKNHKPHRILWFSPSKITSSPCNMMVSRTVAFVFPEGQEMVPRGQVFNFTGVSKRWIDFVWFLFGYGLGVKKTMVLIVFHALCSIWTVTNPGFLFFNLAFVLVGWFVWSFAANVKDRLYVLQHLV